MRIKRWSTKVFSLLAIVLLIATAPAYAQCRCSPCCPSSRISLDTDKNIYHQGQTVTTSLFNPLSYKLVLKRINIKRQNGGLVYNKDFPGTIVSGASWTWSWKQRDNCGNQVSPARYYLTVETRCCGTFSTSFEIIGPSCRPCKPCYPSCRSWRDPCYPPCWPAYCLKRWPSSTEEKVSPQGPIEFSQLGFNQLSLKKGILPLDKLTIGDFNTDNKLDLAVTTKLSSQVFIFLGYGNGRFHQTVNLPLKGQPESIVAGDILRHEFEDLIFVLPEEKNISILPGRGDGVFGELLTVPIQSPSTKLVVGDFNNDRFKDLAVSSYHSNSVQILVGEDHGLNQSDYTLSVENPSSLVSGDFNQDDSLDLVVLSGDKILLAEGKGDGTFKSPVEIQALSSPNVQLAKGDFNNDQMLDLAILEETSGALTIIKGIGDGSFKKGTDFEIGFPVAAIATGDLNNDGITDMVTIRESSSQITIFIASVI